MYDYPRENFTCFILSERLNHTYILLVWNLKLFEILLTILTYRDGFHKYICTCCQIQ